MTLEDRTARLTILIDPRKKALFERLCAEEDATPSQVVRRMIRRISRSASEDPGCPARKFPPPTDRLRVGLISAVPADLKSVAHCLAGVRPTVALLDFANAHDLTPQCRSVETVEG